MKTQRLASQVLRRGAAVAGSSSSMSRAPRAAAAESGRRRCELDQHRNQPRRSLHSGRPLLQANGSPGAGEASNPAMAFPCLDAVESRSAALSAKAAAAATTAATSTSSSTSRAAASRSDSSGPEPSYATGATQTFHCDEPLLLDWGGILREFDVAYETWGELNAAGSNAVLLHTGLSASSHARSTPANPQPGWWERFVGPGPGFPIDTTRFFVVCTNVLGGCYGSTGPSSVDPADGRRYATRFPILTMEDMVRAQFRLLDHLGVERLHASVGSSMGGMQSLAAGVLFPHRVGRVVSVSGCARSHPYSIAMRHTQRQVLMMDPNWRRGFYYDPPGRVPPHAGMKLAREIATVTYRSGPEWEMRFGRRRADPSRPPALCPDFLIETYLDHAGEKFCLTYDANSLLYVSKAMDLFDLGAENQRAAAARREAAARKRSEASDGGGRAGAGEEVPSCGLTLPEAPYEEQPYDDGPADRSSAAGSSEATGSDYDHPAGGARPTDGSSPPADLVAGLSVLRSHPTLVMGVRSDVLFPSWQQREVAEALRRAGNDAVVYRELTEDQSLFGHDTFLLDLENIGGEIKRFLE